MTAAAPEPAPASGLRSAVFAVWMFALAIALGLAGLPLLLGPRRSAMRAVRLWARGALAGLERIVGLRVEVRGREAAPTGPALIGAKHQGMLDILVALALFPDPCIVLKRELMWIPIFGWYAAKAGMIPIDRSAGSRTVRAMTHAAVKALAEDRQIVIYPEGTRRAPGAAPDYRPGIAGLYRQLGVPCIPMATDSGRFWPAAGLLKRPGVAVFVLLPPIPPRLKRDAFMARLEADIESALPFPPSQSSAAPAT